MTMIRATVIVAVGLWSCSSPSGQLFVDGGDDGGGDDANGLDAPAAPSCSDGIQNEMETDVDCGGPNCGKCLLGQTCGSPNDCVTGRCTAGICAGDLAVSFANAVPYGTMLKPYALVSGDLDGDGDVDLVVANEENSTVALFRNNGSGAFQRVPASITDGFATGEYPTGAVLADLNRDGIPDVVTANFHGDSVTVLLGRGTGAAYTLTLGESYPAAQGGETSNLAVGDLNGDGVPDVIATNPMASSMSVFLGRSNGMLAPAIQVPLVAINWPEPTMPYSVAIADFDGDGFGDAAVADNSSGRVLVELGNGDGTFRTGSQPMIEGGYSYIIITHDMNGDGKLDLVVADRNGDAVCVLLGRGAGMFADGVCSTTGSGTGPYSVAVADFNLDGIPDVVTGNFMTGNASVLLGMGNGRFAAPIDAGPTGDSCYGVAVGDFNHDGKPDFATANASSNTVTVKLNTSH
jgi:hypothetical protein